LARTLDPGPAKRGCSNFLALSSASKPSGDLLFAQIGAAGVQIKIRASEAEATPGHFTKHPRST
jgi:hypothetical protein